VRHLFFFNGRSDVFPRSVKGQPTPLPRLLYRLPHSSPPIIGGYFFMSNINKVLLQRTWALHELEFRQFGRGTNISASTSGATLEQSKSRSYGPQFKYEEFLMTRTKLQAIVLSVATAILAFSMVYIPLVSDQRAKSCWHKSQITPHRFAA
jgi:hypothetical protein